MFGHHDDTGYGVNWRLQDDSFDLRVVIGSYTAVYGWDLVKLEHDSTAGINGIRFKIARTDFETVANLLFNTLD